MCNSGCKLVFIQHSMKLAPAPLFLRMPAHVITQLHVNIDSNLRETVGNPSLGSSPTH